MAQEDLTIAVLAVIVLREVWAILKDVLNRSQNKSDKELDEIKSDIKSNTAATMENTVHVKLLTQKMDSFSRLPGDVTEAHNKIRILEHRIGSIDAIIKE